MSSRFRFISLDILAGLVGGASAGAALAGLDWLLVAYEGGRWNTAAMAAAACYAVLLALGAGLVGGGLLAAGLSLRRFAGKWGAGSRLSLTRAGRVFPYFACSLVFGAGALIRFGHLPTWYYAGRGCPPPDSLWLNLALLAAALVLCAVLLILYFRRRNAGRELTVPRAFRRRAMQLVAVAAVLLVAWGGWRLLGGPVKPLYVRSPGSVGNGPGTVDGPPIILILLDTLRWDALSCYGNDERLTPVLDRFCRESVQLRTARAQASWTKPSIATLLTSMYPMHHGAIRRADRLRPGAPALAEALHRGGYYTGAVVANGNLTPRLGFAKGFDEYFYLRAEFALGASGNALRLGLYRIAFQAWAILRRDHRDHRQFKRDAGEVNATVFDWLGGLSPDQQQRFFLFINYLDPHDPYFRHPYDGYSLGAVDGKSPSPSLRHEMERLYGGEVTFLDRHLGALFAELRRLGIYDRAVIGITSDHGEEFFDHQGWWHGLTLYEEQIRVPLLLRLPRQARANSRVNTAVGLIDMPPSLIALAGLAPLIPPAMEGTDVSGLFLGIAEEVTVEQWPRPFFAEEAYEGNILGSLTEGRWKYVVSNPGNPRGLPGEALFDILADPGETQNLIGQRNDIARSMAERLQAFRSSGPGEVPSPTIQLDAETEEHLRALGYIH